MQIPGTLIDVQETEVGGIKYCTIYEWIYLDCADSQKEQLVSEGWTPTEDGRVGRWILRYFGKIVG